jgi:prevent-host-death family protein
MRSLRRPGATGCVYTRATVRTVHRIGIRELRNHTARAVRRAMGGERIVITVDGVPAAQLGPLNDGSAPAALDDLVAAGLVRPPLAASAPIAPTPVAAPPGPSSTEILREHRDP